MDFGLLQKVRSVASINVRYIYILVSKITFTNETKAINELHCYHMTSTPSLLSV